MKITYHGQSCVIVEHEGFRVIIDPFLSANPNAAIRVEDVKVQYVLLTHGHGDHILDAEPIAKANNATIIAADELTVYFASKGLNVHPMNIGGAHNFEFGRVKVTPALHSSSVDVEGTPQYAGMPSGILLTLGGKTIYHAGDTALFSDMKLIGDMHSVDVALLPIGDNFTMGPEDAAVAATWIHAKVTVPIHYNTFPLIAQDGQAFVEDVKKRGLDAKVLALGESLCV